MPTPVDRYLAPQSPWTDPDHERFVRIAAEAGAAAHVLPMGLGGKVFPVSGGVALGWRAPRRRAYRLVELARLRDALGLPLNLEPKSDPVPGDNAERLIVTVGGSTAPRPPCA